MHRLPSLLPVLCLVCGLGAGCDSSSVVGERGTKLKIVKPMDQTVARGKTTDFDVLIGRDEFSGPVALQLSQLPAGVHVTNTKMEIPNAETALTLTLHADPNAAMVTNQRVVVTAKAADLEVSEDFRLTVKE